MVKLTQIDESQASEFQEKPQTTKEQVYSESDSESESDFEDDDIENETLYERIVALKDIIPPQQRNQFASAAESLKYTATSALSFSGNALWVVASSFMLLGVPLSLAIFAETQAQEMEREMALQESAQNVLTSGDEEKKSN